MSDTGEFVAKAFAARHKTVDFQAGVHPVPVTGKVFGEAELSAAVEAALVTARANSAYCSRVMRVASVFLIYLKSWLPLYSS